MKKLLFVSFFILSSYFFYAQTPGSIDISYGTAGKTLINVNNEQDFANSMRYSSDGSIVLCGSSGDDCLIAKLLPGGAPDLSFGTNGTVRFSFGETYSYLNDLVLLSDGKILVTGVTQEAGNSSIGLAKFTPQGDFDLTFGFSGKLIVNIGAYEVANSIIKLPNNKFAITGTIDQGSGSDLMVMRFLSNGSLDVSFDSDGYAVVDLNNGSSDMPRGMVLQNNKILVSSCAFKQSYDAIALVKFNSDGSLDNSFGVGGKSLVDGLNIGDMVIYASTQLAIDYQGRILVAGFFTGIQGNDPMLLRFLSNGYPDNSFGDYGLKVYQIPNGNSINALAIQPDGKIIASGASSDDYYSSTLLLRALDNGNLDPDFGEGTGYITHELGAGTYKGDNADAMLLEGNKVLLCGYAENQNNDADLCVSRYHLGIITDVNPKESFSKMNAYMNSFDKTQIILKGEFPQNEKTIISLLNSVGQVCEVWSSESVLSVKDEKYLKLSKPFSSGVFFVRVSSHSLNATAKVIIQ